MSARMHIRAMPFEKALLIRLTGVDKLAFSVQVVKCKKYLHKTWFEEIFGKSMVGIAVQKVSETPPHRVLNETRMVAARRGNCEDIQCFPYMSMARMP